MKGMHSQGVLSSAKHFPGHGDTHSDSHKTLPTIEFSAKRIDSIELYPYKHLIKEGVSSIMVAHLNIPSLETRAGRPSSISQHIVTDMLKKDLNYKGLIFTDALNMKGASNFSQPGEIDLEAFKAGNDILLISEDVAKASQKIIAAYYAGEITEERLALSVKKILKAKYKVGLNKYKPVVEENLYEDLNNIQNQVVHHQLVEESLTILKNKKEVIPVKELDQKKIAYVSLGDASGNTFYQSLRKYAQVDWIKADKLGEMIEKLQKYNYVIIGFHKSNKNPWKSYKFKDKELVWLYEIARLNTTILNVFTSPYALLNLKTTTNLEGIIVSYQNSEIAQQKTAQAIFGAFPIQGKLPVSIGNEFEIGAGLQTKSLNRISYGLPESVGMNSQTLQRVDSIVNVALAEDMTPGVQLAIARKGKVIFSKNYGYHTYKKKQKVTEDDIYDLASLTKILATLPMIMELHDKGVISMKTKVEKLVPSFKKSNKEDITIQSMLSHYARLKSWIPFYLKTLDSVTSKPSKAYYRTKKTKGFTTKVANNLYIRNDMKDSIYLRIKDSDLLKKKKYKYSDLPYYLLKEYIETYYKNDLNALTQQHFYKTIGAYTTGFLPIERFDKNRIIPTEDDKTFRQQVIHGYVHDQGAAMLGGIGGHAGLFSNANDVVKLMQTYLNGGSYGGRQFIKKETLDAYNTCYYCKEDVRRGVGFDKPQLGEVGPTCGCVSKSSFGHSGFTGTFAWADPAEDLVYVFLSNRTFPDATNRKLISNDIRSEIQRIIYEAIHK